MNKTENSQQICCNLLRAVLLKVGGHEAQHQATSAKTTYLQCRNYIDENFSEITSISQMARDCGWNPVYIARLFKRFSGIKPSEYINRLKLNKAAVLLNTTETSVKDIAHETGFKDRYTFSKKFKKSYDLSPNRYRNKM